MIIKHENNVQTIIYYVIILELVFLNWIVSERYLFPYNKQWFHGALI